MSDPIKKTLKKKNADAPANLPAEPRQPPTEYDWVSTCNLLFTTERGYKDITWRTAALIGADRTHIHARVPVWFYGRMHNFGGGKTTVDLYKIGAQGRTQKVMMRVIGDAQKIVLLENGVKTPKRVNLATGEFCLLQPGNPHDTGSPEISYSLEFDGRELELECYYNDYPPRTAEQFRAASRLGSGTRQVEDGSPPPPLPSDLM